MKTTIKEYDPEILERNFSFAVSEFEAYLRREHTPTSIETAAGLNSAHLYCNLPRSVNPSVISHEAFKIAKQYGLNRRVNTREIQGTRDISLSVGFNPL